MRKPSEPEIGGPNPPGPAEILLFLTIFFYSTHSIPLIVLGPIHIPRSADSESLTVWKSNLRRD